MFTYLKLKNFKSFDEVEFNFKRTSSETKKFVAIYGENGIGKTNFVTAYKFLEDSLLTLLFKNVAERTMESNIEDKEKKINFMMNMIDFTKKMQEVRMIGNEEDTEVEYGFEINGKEGYYKIVFGDRVKSEELYYVIEKNRNIIFQISENNEKIEKKLNDNIFFGKDYKDELLKEIDKYWGKNTFLSIFVKEVEEKNAKFMQENISVNLANVMNMLMRVSIVYRNSPVATVLQGMGSESRVLNNVSEGKIVATRKEVLYKYQNILRDFFTQTYSDIKDVYYKTREGEDIIEYNLYFKKKIGNKLIDIEYRKESSGTRKILDQFNYIIGALWGEIVIIDEIDNGVHDLLMKAIIESLKDEITGQLIITTHNTLLMETLDKQDIYIIVSDYKGQKKVNCISDYDMKIQKNNNIRELYLKGAFGGIPSINMVDFTEIKEKFRSEKQYDNKGGI